MWIRNYKGDFVFIDIIQYDSEVELYQDLWKIKFNEELEENEIDFNREIMRLIIS